MHTLTGEQIQISHMEMLKMSPNQNQSNNENDRQTNAFLEKAADIIRKKQGEKKEEKPKPQQNQG